MKRLYRRHKEKINYLLVGGWNTLFGYLAFICLYCAFGRQLHYLVLFVISNIIAITNAYVGYKTFVFRTRGNYLREYLRFYIVYGGAMAVNFLLLPFCVEMLHLTPPAAQGILTMVCVIFSYVGHKSFSFRQ